MGVKKLAGQVLVYILVVSVFLAAAWGGNLAVSVVSREMPLPRSCTIVIDAGHGGEDGGAVSCTGARESGINLEIALRLRDLLHLMGYRTKMIRTADTAVYTGGNTLAQKKVSDLKQRVRLVNETENPVLVSIHQNTFPDARYSGAQIFYAAAGESKDLAGAAQNAFRDTVNPGSTRQCKEAAGVYLMEQIRCTGILAECGFLSNPAEEARLRTADYQQKVAAVLTSALVNFLDGQTND